MASSSECWKSSPIFSADLLSLHLLQLPAFHNMTQQEHVPEISNEGSSIWLTLDEGSERQCVLIHEAVLQNHSC